MMKKRLALLLTLVAVLVSVVGTLAPSSAGAKPVNRGQVKFCPPPYPESPWGVTLRPGQMCLAPARQRVYFVDSSAFEYARGGYGLCVGVYNAYLRKWVSAPAGRNPRCSHTNYAANYLGDLFGGLNGSPAVLNASAVTLHVHSSYSSRLGY
jgi:hypothetical protein